MISIVIPGYNSAKHLRQCLEAIYRQSYKDFEVIFIDNGSTDNTGSLVKSYPGINLIKNEANKGFCAALNQGIKRSRGWLILSLNSDVILDEHFLEEMKKAADGDVAALFCPKILNLDGSIIDSAGLQLSGFYRFFDRGSREYDIGQYDNKSNIFGPCAAAAVYKKEMLEDIKYNDEYFDEDFFFLGEDFDIAWRARRKNWKAVFVSSAICHHMRNSTNFNGKFRQYLSFRNRYFLLIKNLDFSIRYIVVFILYDMPRLIYMFFTNKYTLKALYEILKYTPGMLRKRNS
ncbi:MAG: glycosyltransferase family 2 protein [Candidatus Omnitrophica bacterium]|nr:glycosyltransferase family 2 protein [Candidatus Omnitrophota bacterium]